MLLYTDGITEARDELGEFYPLADRAFLLKDPDAWAALEALRKERRRTLRSSACWWPGPDQWAPLRRRRRSPLVMRSLTTEKQVAQQIEHPGQPILRMTAELALER
ncbi:hypothetical protein QFZ66_001711 [Streptomyces sp. B4I13]|uniref:hypothetical protein n=1 Tax=Streptomyces sp. B4I13 TaxID=3042271 RepID=UPI0027892DDF|nr:hypothetical protein [Streptomyces sp. B4I13]MDQ0957833.1 hypothetical protein [Streptomyces sp. B4I13]